MKILLVVVHYRTTSLTHAAALAFAQAARANGHVIEWADLYAEGFDPALRADDEPDWTDSNKQYSPAVRAEMQRISRNEATVIVFPVWWWSMPAMLKGWIDRVWNNGWAYGEHSYPHTRALLVGIAGNGPHDFAKRGYDAAMKTTLETGILGYCQISGARLELLHGSTEGPEHPPVIIDSARRLGATF